MNTQPLASQIAYDLPGAADQVAVSVEYLRREIHASRLRARKVGRKYVISDADLRAWFDTLPEA